VIWLEIYKYHKSFKIVFKEFWIGKYKRYMIVR